MKSRGNQGNMSDLSQRAIDSWLSSIGDR